MNFFTSTCILAFLSPLFIGILVALKGREKKDSIFFGLTCIASAIWALGAFKFSTTSSQHVALFWIKIAHIGIILTPTFFFHYIYQLTKSYKKTLLLFVYLFAMFFLALTFLYENFIYSRFAFNQFYFFFFEINKNPIYLVFYVIFYWIVVLTSFHLLLRFFKGTIGVKRNHLKYLIIGSVIAWLGPAGMFLTVFGLPIYPYSNIFVGIYPFVFAYAILRHRLMDIDFIFKRTMAYSISAVLLMGIFVVIVLTITKVGSLYAQADSFKISVVAAMIIALLFNPIRNKMQMLIDKLFHKKTYDYYGIIQKVSHDLVSMFDVIKIYSFVGDTIFSTLGLKNIYLLSAATGGNYTVVYSRLFEEKEDKKNEGTKDKETSEIRTELKIDKNSEIVKLLRTSDDILIKDELPAIKEILGQEIIDNITDTLKPFNGEAVIPVFVDNKLEILFVLGERLSGDIFSDEDIKLLNTVSHQTAIAMRNAQLYVEKFSTEKLASIGMMSATFAHEIRNPLTSIKTFAQLMPEKYADIEFRETFSKIVVDEIGRIDGLIKDLLSVSSEEAVPGINELDITALIDETLEHIKDKLELEKRKINVEKFYKNVKINTLGDSKKLKQAFINLISNGCQAMEDNGVLTVNIIPNGQNVVVTITDTGKGISSQDIARIFDPFFTTKATGVGLGLAISKKIIEDHGGSIKVESKLSKGTTFTISLPMQNQN